ncbi:Hypothetical protein CINCED_3A020982 [Cinara cedri]|uniref:Uncharacterized protein n=1 Tax=Cinara cedri TaxID=506608 RepID=A0A5E4N0W8_9HEMI|nr:Hypothetical protein CINCED_3A020982 [Cinara cedri]
MRAFKTNPKQSNDPEAICRIHSVRFLKCAGLAVSPSHNPNSTSYSRVSPAYGLQASHPTCSSSGICLETLVNDTDPPSVNLNASSFQQYSVPKFGQFDLLAIQPSNRVTQPGLSILFRPALFVPKEIIDKLSSVSPR